MYVRLKDLLVRLNCQLQQTKNSLHYWQLSYCAWQASTRTVWYQPVVPVSCNVSPTILCGCHAIYLSVIISSPLWTEHVRFSAVQGKKTTELLHFMPPGVQQMQFWLVPGAAVTNPPPPVIFCQVEVSHIYVTESMPPVIFIPTRVGHICSGSGDFRKLQWMSY